jgi:hypothetical protein
MKRFYFQLIFAFHFLFSINTYAQGTETFEVLLPLGATSWTSPGLTFSRSSSNFDSEEFSAAGAVGSDRFLDNLDAPAINSTDSTSITGGTTLFTMESIEMYVSSSADGSIPINDGSVTIRGLVGGNPVFMHSKTGAFPTSLLGVANGFFLVDFTELIGVGDVTSMNIDGLEISIYGAFQYFSVHNFQFDNQVLNIDPPEVQSIAVLGVPNSTATSVDYLVTFNEDAFMVDASDFIADTTGTFGTISGISGSVTAYNVTVSAISGEGPISIDLISGNNIADALGNSPVAAFASGENHIVARRFQEMFEGFLPNDFTFSSNGVKFTTSTVNFNIELFNNRGARGSDQFLSNGANQGKGKVYNITTPEAEKFTVDAMDFYLSSEFNGANPKNDGTLLVEGILNGFNIYTIQKTTGFPIDFTQTGNPSMYIFDNTVYYYMQMANTNATNLLPATMYHTLIRGDRTTDLTNNTETPSVSTLRVTGELTAGNEGFETISLNAPEQRFSAAGNPFQSQVDMNTVLTTNATNISPNFYWVWDPTLGLRGAYTAIIASLGITLAGDSDANQYLQARQVGWVYTAGAGQSSVSFTQASKNTTGSETSVFRNSSDLTSQGQLRLSLYESSALANNESAADGVLILFDTEGSNAVDANDAPNITNLDENFATNNNGILLSIENRAAPEDAEEIQLEINTYRNTNYTIVSEGISMQGATAFLYDNFTNISTEIPQSGTVNYSYSIDSGISGSITSDRFKIVFAANALSLSTYDMEDIRLYPNPTNIGKFYLNIPSGTDDLDVTIYNILGARLYQETGFLGGGRVTLNIGSTLSMGTYFVKLSSQGKTITKKLTIN